MKNLLSVVTFLALVSTSSAFANDAKVVGAGIDKRVERQNQRIDRKLKEKKITAEKAADLKKDVQAVEEKKVAMLKEGDGKLNKVQRKELQGELKKTSQEIKSSNTTAQ